ncbi:hypothetical protein C5167_020418 [Papaver somniferum]|uniref:FMP27/BLTP2/Hobbit GFWDK motif-containing RBG unit domain-containing protein n=1 Tax=Papaver somniferum TaxID=3469 RepID=A0A4Y7IW75_PAPSO|nr:hypothetical protein C5167_020418 [Papaver somniferum]
MAFSPIRFLFLFLLLSVIGWVVFIFAARLLAWILSRVMGASVGFRVAGWNCLRDVVVKFKKGAVESVSVGEIKLSLRQSLVKLGVGFISRDPKLQLVICDLEIVIRTPAKSVKKARSRSKSGRSRSSGRGKWMVVANMARFLSVSVTELIVKVPKAITEVKDLRLDISKDGGSKSNLLVKLHLQPILVHMGESRLSYDQSSYYNQGGSISEGQLSSDMAERGSAAFFCEEFSLSCEFGHDREVGVVIRDVDFTCGEVSVNLNEEMFVKNNAPMESFSKEDKVGGDNLDMKAASKLEKKQKALLSLKKYTSLFPEKVSFNLPKLDVRFAHRAQNLFNESNVTGIHLRCSKSPFIEDMGESTRFDVQLDFIEIHLFREGGTSILEILKLAVVSSFYVPIQPEAPLRAEVDIKLGGTQCNIIMSRIRPWLSLHLSKKKKMVLREERPMPEKSQATEFNLVLWTCTVSAPEMTIVLYSISGSPLYQGCSQSSHVFANNIASTGTSVHMELGELHLHMADEHRERLKESLFGAETNTGSLMHIAKVILDWGKKESESHEERGSGKRKLVLSIDVTGMGVYLGFQRLESLISTAISFQTLFKSLSAGKRKTPSRGVQAAKPSGKGVQLIKLNLEQCSVNYCGDVGVEDAVVADPKRVNYGSQGGQNAKFVRRSGGQSDIAVCSLFSATDISVRWEPDVHLSLFELMLHMKLLIHNQKQLNQAKGGLSSGKDVGSDRKADVDSLQSDKQHKKRESVYAIDVEMLNISAEAGDGVDVKVQVQSIFSENARIGVLLEGFMLSFNEARVFKSSRMQVSRIPNISSSSSDSKVQTKTWDWVIQGLDVHICMPYRLQLRAIEDAVEDMIRGLKLVSKAKTNLIFPKKESSKPKKPSSTKFGCLKFCIRKLTADIEEEPMQGWLEEHYHLMRNEACELAVRMKFLDDLVSEDTHSSGNNEPDESCPDRKVQYNGVDIDLNDTAAIQKLREEIHRQVFQSYYQACKNLATTEGSGAYKEGFQSGFKFNSTKTSLLSVCATELEVTLKKIEGDNTGMLETVRKLDPVCLENEIPFSRMYGRNFNLNTGSLVVKIRNYLPILSASGGKCEGRVILAQQATCFQPQMQQDVYIGNWRKVRMLRSVSGTTPPMKTYLDLPLHFQKADIGYGVGFEPAFTDISYAFTVALRRANLSVRNPVTETPPPKKEKSLPWWDEVRNYVHGNIGLYFTETRWEILGTTDPYEKVDKLHVVSGYIEILQSDGQVSLSAKDFNVYLSSLVNLVNSCSLKLPDGVPGPFLVVPALSIVVTMDWECDSGKPLYHYLWALPVEGKSRTIVYDPFRSTSLSLRWNISFRPPLPVCEKQSPSSTIGEQAALDGAAYSSANKSEHYLKDSPILNVAAHDLAWLNKFWNLNYLPPNKLRTFSRWPRFGVPRIARSGNLSLDKGVDLHMLKAYINKEDSTCVVKEVQMAKKGMQSVDGVNSEKSNYMSAGTEKHKDDGFLLSSDYFTIRRQAPKADPAKLLSWQEAGKRNPEMTYVRSEFENGSESDEHTRSDPSDDDGFNVVIADNCQRVFVYGLKLLWTIENRDAVWSFAGGLSKAFQPPKPSPSRQYTQRKLLEENQVHDDAEKPQDEASKLSPLTTQGSPHPSPQHADAVGSHPSSSHTVNIESSALAALAKNDDSEEEGTRHFMVNVIQPQFNLHSEEANGRFLLAAASGRVLARSFHSVLHVGLEMIEQALGTETVNIPECQPEMTWKRVELSVMLKHVQAHVAPTDVDPGAGIQWLPKILGSSPKVKRTGALLERVFMPCTMYFRYTRHKGGTPELKVKPLKELTFNSPNITATMTSRQFQVMLDVLTNLLFARLPKPRKSSISSLSENDEDVEEEADEVVPDGVEEVELARISLEKSGQERKLLLDDIRKLSSCNTIGDSGPSPEKEDTLWMVKGGISTLVHGLKKELGNTQKSRKAASAALRDALQKAAQLRLMEKEKNKSPSYAMRISLKINKVVWGMLADGKPFAEAEINNMIYDFDRDYKDVGIAQFTTKSIVVRNCLPNAKSDTLLAAWNPPAEWGKNVMLRVDSRQGAPKDGNSALELFQEVWKVSTTAGSKRVRKTGSGHEPSVTKDSDFFSKLSASVIASAGSQSSSHGDTSHTSKSQNVKGNIIPGTTPELRRTSSFDRSWEENVAESVANELILHAHSSSISSRSGPLGSTTEHLDESSRYKPKDPKIVKPGRPSHEEKKVGKAPEDKRTRPRKMMEFHNIKISQVELLVTYEGSRFAVSDLRLLMDSFHRVEFTGTWRRLFSRVKKHIIWGVLKSVTGMQGKKFKDKAHTHKEPTIIGIPDTDLHFSDSDGEKSGKPDLPISFLKRPNDGAGDGFVTSIRGLFNSQRRKAKAFVLRTMRGDGENDYQGDWSESDAEFSPFARQLTITKAKRLIRRHTKKFRSRGQKGGTSHQRDSIPDSPRETSPVESADESSRGSSPYEDFNDSPRHPPPQSLILKG